MLFVNAPVSNVPFVPILRNFRRYDDIVNTAPKSPRSASGGMRALLSDNPFGRIMLSRKFANSLAASIPAFFSMASSHSPPFPVVRRNEDRSSPGGKAVSWIIHPSYVIHSTRSDVPTASRTCLSGFVLPRGALIPDSRLGPESKMKGLPLPPSPSVAPPPPVEGPRRSNEWATPPACS